MLESVYINLVWNPCQGFPHVRSCTHTHTHTQPSGLLVPLRHNRNIWIPTQATQAEHLRDGARSVPHNVIFFKAARRTETILHEPRMFAHPALDPPRQCLLVKESIGERQNRPAGAGFEDAPDLGKDPFGFFQILDAHATQDGIVFTGVANPEKGQAFVEVSDKAASAMEAV